MNRTPVVSSNIKSVGYDAATNMLEVEFKDGAVWEYAGVPSSVYDDLAKALSVGKWFSTEVRGRYAGRKITPP